MKSVKTRTHFCDRHRNYSNEFKAAASLHCHTYHSREFLSFIPHYTSKIPIVSNFYKAEMERYEKNNGKAVNFNQAYWTPPVSPMQVLDAETTQINQYLSLAALVSITDHDEIEACMRLQVLNGNDQIPISLEWTVPFERTCFHIGVHNLPQHKAAEISCELKKYTYKASDAMELGDLFVMLNECENTLVVLNHPLWDLDNLGKETHEDMLGTFLAKYGSDDNGNGNWIHAFEINGFRSWRENKVVMKLAEDIGFPTVTGGDRHGNRANTLLNLTPASTFTEYVSQIRNDRQSDVIIMPDYGHSKFPGLALTARTFESIADVIRYNPNHPLGQYRWTDRIFVDVGNDRGQTPLSHYWKNGGPAWIRAVLWCISKIGSREVLSLTSRLTTNLSTSRRQMEKLQKRKESHIQNNHSTRVAFFPDSYLEVNGVARTARQFTTFAEDHDIPFLCIYGGGETKKIECGNLTKLSLKKTRVGFKFEADQRFDFLMWRHVNLVIKSVRAFKADVIHITGPNDIGQLGAYVAYKLNLPLVASWHTNLHEYLGLRIKNSIRLLPSPARALAAKFAEDKSLWAIQKFYKGAKVLLAPNQELCDMLEECSGKRAFTMARGIDTTMFTPAKRFRRDSTFTIGYVGRITPEKNVALLEYLENELSRTSNIDFRFRIIGTGSELNRLRRTMSRADFPGVLEGEELARAYADLDLFVFPSETDTFGNVVLEAQASGVPAIVTRKGGPKFIIKDGVTGIIANDKSEFLNAILLLMNNQNKLNSMREASRKLAIESSWDNIFNQVYKAYEHGLNTKHIKVFDTEAQKRNKNGSTEFFIS